MAITVTLNGTDYTIPSPGEANDWGARLNAYLVALAGAGGAGAGDWHNIGDEDEPAFEGGWANAGDSASVAAYCAAGPLILVKGTVVTGTPGLIFTLPVGFRPAETMTFGITKSNEGYTPDAIIIAATGTVTLGSAANGFIVYLDGIAFRTVA